MEKYLVLQSVPNNHMVLQESFRASKCEQKKVNTSNSAPICVTDLGAMNEYPEAFTYNSA